MTIVTQKQVGFNPQAPGLAALQFLAQQGAKFALPTGRTKRGLPNGWPNMPHTLEQAMAHAQQGGNVGLLTGHHSGGIIAVDIDVDYQAVVASLGPYARTVKVERTNAPDRGKLLYRVDFPVKSQSWRPAGDSPWAELLSDGRHAIIPPSEFEGGQYVLKDLDDGIASLSDDDLALVWYKLTIGRDGLPPEARGDGDLPATKPQGQQDDAKALVLAAWSTLDVFAHHGLAREVKQEHGGELRLLGNGGLLIKANGEGWYNHSAATGGGDALSAWAYCKTGKPDLTGQTFWDVLQEMAAAKGLALPATKPQIHLNGKGTGPARMVDADGVIHEMPQGFAERPHNTDMGNARRMYAHTQGKVMYVPAFGKWYIWSGTHWQEDDNFAILALAKQTVLSMYADLAGFADDSQRKEQLKWIIQSENRARLESMIALLRAEPGISVQPDSLDQRSMLLPVRNGTIDLTTGRLLPADPAHRFTKCLDVPYDPEAQCPLWESFLLRIMAGNPEMVAFIQRLVGHALTGDATGKYFVFMYGEKGNNGKSTLVEAIMRLLGPFALKSPTEMVMAKRYQGGVPNDIARLRGVRFTVTNEVDEGMTLSESVIKDLTGNDTLTARYMRAEWFDFQAAHKLWMYGNHKPEVRGTGNALWDRVKLIPFEVEIPAAERDPHFADKLAQELPGILAWAVRGCLQWQKVGIAAPAAVDQATGEYKAEQDVIGQFIEDCCEVGAGFEVAAGTIYRAYEAWCKETGIQAESGTKFGGQLTKRGYGTKRLMTGKVRLGLQLNAYGRTLLPAPAAHWADDH